MSVKDQVSKEYLKYADVCGRFRTDGSVNARLFMAGYMETTFYDENGATWRDLPFGVPVHKRVIANLHDHLSSWKVDLDVHGLNNTFVKEVGGIFPD